MSDRSDSRTFLSTEDRVGGGLGEEVVWRGGRGEGWEGKKGEGRKDVQERNVIERIRVFRAFIDEVASRLIEFY